MTRRLHVNMIACDGRGLCVEMLPELIRLDDWGYPIVEIADVPRQLETMAKRAANACPTLALVLEQVSD
jgi:ferredoxin